MRRPRPTRTDVAIAAAAAVLGVVSVLVSEPGGDVERGPDALGVALGLLATAPLALRRTAPFAVLAVTGAAVVLAAARGSAIPAGALGLVFAATSAAYLTDRRGAVAAGALFLAAAGPAIVLSLSGDPARPTELAEVVVLAVLVAVVGDVLRTLRDRNRELEALRAAAAREAVADDRVRIAREVHDVVGHALAGIALQARAGRRLLERDPARAGEALRTIDELATGALGDTRTAVGLIRAPAGDAPGPLLGAALDGLVARLQGDELRVRLRREGDVARAPAAVQAAAYRIVQEALSNVARHAAPATADVVVAARDGALEVEVRDDGPGRDDGDGAGAGDGNGLSGMRARAALHGGTLEAGPAPGGGWRVRARLRTGAGPR